MIFPGFGHPLTDGEAWGSMESSPVELLVKLRTDSREREELKGWDRAEKYIPTRCSKVSSRTAVAQERVLSTDTVHSDQVI